MKKTWAIKIDKACDSAIIKEKRNNMLLAGMFSMMLALGLCFTGCASFKIDEGSTTEETITLKSVDLAPLIAEYVQKWQPIGLGPITAPSEPGNEELVSLANELGYTEELRGPLLTMVSRADSLLYPEAKVSKFTATVKKGVKREGIKIQSWLEYPPVYVVSQVQDGKAAAGTKNLALFLTEGEANAYADRLRPQAPKGISIKVGSYTPSKLLTCTLFKPL